jgi:hypothetical protein
VEFLRRTIGLSHPAAVRVVDRLVDSDWCAGDQRVGARRWRSRPRPPGDVKHARFLDVRRRVLAGALPELSRAEWATLSAILVKALVHLSDAPGTTICRRCDQGRCRRADCPVARRQIDVGAPPPDPVPLDD